MAAPKPIKQESVFAKFLKLGKIAGLDRRKVAQAREWFRQAAGMVTTMNAGDFMRSQETAKFLPDKFPLQPYFRTRDGKVRRDGFLGINLHYLSPPDRARLMDALYQNLVGVKSEDKRLAITYDILKSAASYKYFKPCVKVYLYSHVKSRYLLVPYQEWEVTLYLPLERFEKQSKSVVWRDSRAIANGQKPPRR